MKLSKANILLGLKPNLEPIQAKTRAGPQTPSFTLGLPCRLQTAITLRKLMNLRRCSGGEALDWLAAQVQFEEPPPPSDDRMTHSRVSGGSGS